MGAQLLAVEARHEVGGRADADQRLEGQRAELPALGHGVRGGAQLVGREVGQQLGARPQDPDVRPEPLVGRARQRVAAEGGDVDRAVRRGVDGVDEDARAGGVGGRDDARQVGDGADRVGRGGDRDPARARREHGLDRGGGQLERLAVGLGEADLAPARAAAMSHGATLASWSRRVQTISSPGCSDRHGARRSAWSARSSRGRRRRPRARRPAGGRPRRAPRRRAHRCARRPGRRRRGWRCGPSASRPPSPRWRRRPSGCRRRRRGAPSRRRGRGSGCGAWERT